jgi:spore germination cell wall hydrolase CwlJ-like protein
MQTASDGASLVESRQPDRLALMMIVALVVGAFAAIWIAVCTPPGTPVPARSRVLAAVPTAAAPPPIEPLILKSVTPQDAVAINETVPFSSAPNPAARPFFLPTTAANYERSLDCLAAAGLYEAGSGDPDGQRAVLQVVLNRLRHPAFPKTICGVVFQGQERSTGCQFTFTCDGAMRHVPSADAWRRSREVAAQMLGGRVYKSVGYSTHYHTNWVVPYWSSSLDKVAQVGTHLFFRWAGWWGTPGAFRNAYGGGEPAIAKLAALSPAHRSGVSEEDIQLATLSNVPPEAVADPELLAKFDKRLLQQGDSFIIPMGRKVSADKLAGMALAACGTRDYCKVMAWAKTREAPQGFPIDPALLPAMSFSYLRDRRAGYEKALWNCDDYDRSDPRECMKARSGTGPRAVTARFNVRSGKEKVDMKTLRDTLAKREAVAKPSRED